MHSTVMIITAFGIEFKNPKLVPVLKTKHKFKNGKIFITSLRDIKTVAQYFVNWSIIIINKNIKNLGIRAFF